MWAVVREEWRMTAAFFLREDVSLSLELRVWLNRTNLRKNLATLNVFTLRAAQQATNVIAGFTLIEQLAEHFNAGNDRLNRVLQANDFDFFADLHNATLDTTRHNRAATRDREHVFNRHQERLILRTLWLRNIRINRLHEFQNRVMADFWTLVFKRANG